MWRPKNWAKLKEEAVWQAHLKLKDPIENIVDELLKAALEEIRDTINKSEMGKVELNVVAKLEEMLGGK